MESLSNIDRIIRVVTGLVTQLLLLAIGILPKPTGARRLILALVLQDHLIWLR